MTTEPPPAPASWFDDAVEAYERARPSYPEQLFDDLEAYMGRPSGAPAAEALEIGPGTGKATASLLARGMRVTGVEPGPKLAAFLRRKFAGEPGFRAINAKFEDAEPADDSYDLVVSATAFGWVDPAVRLTKSHRILRAGGVLAVIDSNQIASPADRGFFERCFPIYLRYRPDEEQTETQTEENVRPPSYGDIAASPLFESVELRRYRWDQTYPTELYADLVRSYSNTAMMEPDAREGLIESLCALIDEEFDGYVVRPLVITLVTARKRHR